MKIPSQIITINTSQQTYENEAEGWVLIDVDATEGDISLTLPDAQSCQALLCFKRLDNSSNTVTISVDSPGQYIEYGAPGSEGTSVTLPGFSSGVNTSLQFVSNLSNWRIV